MDPDLIYVVGVVIAALALPAVINAFSTTGRSFVPAIALAACGSALIVFAHYQTTRDGYSLTEIPAIIQDLLK